MKVTMAEINRRGNAIVNQVLESGESAVIMKHGKAVAEIRPLQNASARRAAIDAVLALQPVEVSDSLETVIDEARRRGL